MDEKRLCMIECQIEELKRRLDKQEKAISEFLMLLMKEAMKQ